MVRRNKPDAEHCGFCTRAVVASPRHCRKCSATSEPTANNSQRTQLTMSSLSPPGQQGKATGSANDNIRRFTAPSRPRSPPPDHALFHPKTRAFVYGLQPKACQGMLDFDFICEIPQLTFGGGAMTDPYFQASGRRPVLLVSSIPSAVNSSPRCKRCRRNVQLPA